MAAKDDLAKAKAALEQGVKAYSFEGTTYDLTALRKLVEKTLPARVEKETAAAKKAAAASEAAAKLRDPKLAQQAVNQAQKEFDDAVKRFAKRTVTQSVVDAARIKLVQAQETLARLTPTPTKPVTTPVTTAPAATPSDDSSLKAEQARLAGLAGNKGGGGGGGGKGGTGGTGTKPPTKPGEPAATTGSIFDELVALFPSYRGWTEEAATNYFGSDLIKVLRRAANGDFGVGKDRNEQALRRAIEGTTYWQTTATAIRNWDALDEPNRQTRIKNQKELLAQTFGELQLDDATLTELATTIQRTGLTEIGASQLVYGAAFKRAPTATGPQSRQLALESEKADQLRKIARAYGYSPKDLDAQIESVLTGQSYLGGAALTDAALRERAEKAARGAFPHLKDQFDSGLTLEDMFGNYRDIAARVLEVDPAQVDFMKDPQKWLKPFGDAKTGQMSLSDWVRELKTNQDYGWRFTNQANQQVSSVVSTLERAFGLIK